MLEVYVISGMKQKGKSDWREGNGRPTKEQLVRQWRIDNPQGKKIDVIVRLVLQDQR